MQPANIDTTHWSSSLGASRNAPASTSGTCDSASSSSSPSPINSPSLAPSSSRRLRRGGLRTPPPPTTTARRRTAPATPATPPPSLRRRARLRGGDGAASSSRLAAAAGSSSSSKRASSADDDAASDCEGLLLRRLLRRRAGEARRRLVVAGAARRRRSAGCGASVADRAADRAQQAGQVAVAPMCGTRSPARGANDGLAGIEINRLVAHPGARVDLRAVEPRLTRAATAAQPHDRGVRPRNVLLGAWDPSSWPLQPAAGRSS